MTGSFSYALGISVLLVGMVGFAAKLCIEGEVLDVLTLIAICISLGYLWK